MQNKNIKITQDLVAEKMLWGLWRSVDEQYKVDYRKNIWEQFENAIRSASYTGSLKVFLTNLQNRIPLSIQAQFMKDILIVVDSNQDNVVLDWIRNETTYLVMIVRLMNQERKNEFENNKKEETQEIDSNYQDLFTNIQ